MAVVSAAALAVTLTACGGESQSSSAQSSSSAPVSGGDLTIGRTGQSVSNLDPDAEELTANNAYTLDKIFDALVTQGPDGAVAPSLATAWTTSTDGKTWTFTLRDGVKFSDGIALTPADVVYSIKRHLEVKGALPLSAPITDVAADGTNKVTVTLSKPYTPLLTELATFASSIVPDNLRGKNAAEFFAKPIGTGPFTLGDWNKDAGTIKLVKNTNYWRPGQPYLDSVTFNTVADDQSLVAQLQGKQLDAIADVPIANVAALKANPAITVTTVSSWNQDQVFFNTVKGPFANKALRQAVVHAIDRKSLTESTTFGTGTPGTTYIPATVRYSDQQADILAYDLEAAKKSLAESGVAKGTTVTLLVDGGSQARTQQAQIIQNSLAQIGLTVKIQTLDDATFWDTFPSGNYDFALSTVIADTGDPDNVTYWQVDSTGASKSFHTGYANPEVDKLAQQGRETPDGDARKQIYAKIQQIVAQDSPNLSLDYTAGIAASQSTVHGLVLIPNGTLQLADAWIAK
ncbi:MAG: ABC transporter substrate-binding protein [Gordonia sp. (in: high G+C Gram-positive bacteria)]